MLVPRLACPRAILWALFATIALSIPYRAGAETQAQTCDRLAGDAVKMDSIDGEAALSACSNAVASAPQDKHLQYEYARSLERSGKRDRAKQIYQWIAGDGYAPANAALARLAGPLTGEAAYREKLARRFDAQAHLASSILRAITQDPDGMGIVLRQTGKDAGKIKAWVQSNTRLQAYPGMLRDASGVLMDRAGNSLDRSLLLSSLLNREGYRVRIARAKLAPSVAQKLLQQIMAQNPALTPGGTATLPDDQAFMRAVGTDPFLDKATVQGAVDEARSASQEFKAAATDIFRQIVPKLEDAVGHDATRDSRIAIALGDALKDYFWVQLDAGGGKWSDMVLDSDVGAPSAEQVFFPQDMPATLKQRVTLKVVMEKLDGGKLSEVPLLQESWLPSTAVNRAISIRHTILPLPPVDALQNDPHGAAAYLNDLANAYVVVPVLQLGGKTIKGQAYDFTGRTSAPTTEGVAAMGGGAILNGNQLSSAMDSVFGPAAPTQPSTQSVVTAEWLEIDVDIPGRTTERHRRAIFDLLNPSARRMQGSIQPPQLDTAMKTQRVLRLAGTIDVFAFGAAPSQDWVDRRTLTILQNLFTQAANIVRTPKPLSALMTAAAPDRLDVLAWAWARRRDDPGERPVAPNIVLTWQIPQVDGAVDEVFDIVANETSAWTKFSGALAQGVHDSVLEGLLVGKGAGNAAIAMARASNSDLVMIGRAGNTVLDQQDVPAAAKAAMQSDLESGRIVVANLKAADAWWRIDPVTGNALSVDIEQRGAAMVEYANILLDVGLAAVCFYSNDKKYDAAMEAAGTNRAARNDARTQAAVGMLLCGVGAVISVSGWGAVKAADVGTVLSEDAAAAGRGGIGPGTVGPWVGVFGKATSLGGTLYGLSH